MASFKKNQSITQFQTFNRTVYALPDDRMYSIWDLLTQTQRFLTRALKGIRKEDRKKLEINLLISFSFLTAIASRLHLDIEDILWRRFPYLCSYCGKTPCVCKKLHPKARQKIKINNKLRPRTLAAFQKMFGEVYPSAGRTLPDSGIHLAEEMGEVTEAIHNFLGQHKPEQFEGIALEIADCVSCIFGVANSAGIDVAKGLARLFKNNCHVCHKAPCACGFAVIAQART
jgi:NTP pyrophosphatase (non-canonical NTP hydrolase)